MATATKGESRAMTPSHWQDALDATDMDDMVRSIRDARICMRTARQYMDQA